MFSFATNFALWLHQLFIYNSDELKCCMWISFGSRPFRRRESFFFFQRRETTSLAKAKHWIWIYVSYDYYLVRLWRWEERKEVWAQRAYRHPLGKESTTTILISSYHLSWPPAPIVVVIVNPSRSFRDWMCTPIAWLIRNVDHLNPISHHPHKIALRIWIYIYICTRRAFVSQIDMNLTSSVLPSL